MCLASTAATMVETVIRILDPPPNASRMLYCCHSNAYGLYCLAGILVHFPHAGGSVVDCGVQLSSAGIQFDVVVNRIVVDPCCAGCSNKKCLLGKHICVAFVEVSPIAAFMFVDKGFLGVQVICLILLFLVEAIAIAAHAFYLFVKVSFKYKLFIFMNIRFLMK